MSDLPQPSPDDAPKPDKVPAQNVPTPADILTTDSDGEVPAVELAEPEIEIPVDPVAQAADREGFRFIGIAFVFFFIIIIVCAGIVSLVMKNMGI